MKKNTLSVIIGRFQTNKLHEGHLELFKRASEVSDRILVMIGTTSAVGTSKNPLDFITVASMIDGLGITPNIVGLSDCHSDSEWSELVDNTIDEHLHSYETDVIIWGGRDNSISNSYNGKYPVKIIDEVGNFSATSIRSEIGKNVIDSFDFRSGIIYASQNRYPIVYSTVDVIIKVGEKYLVGKKGLKYCFVGGFVDSADNTVEESAIREMKEETGITQYDSISFLGSMKIDDPRYRGTNDSIMTHCFLVNEPKDLENEIKDREFSEFKLASIEELKECLHEYHKPLLTLIK